MRLLSAFGLFMIGLLGWAQGCSSDESPGPSTPTPAPTTTSTTPINNDAGPAPGPLTYVVPASGGTTKVVLLNGASVDFTFPASAGGKSVTLTPTDGPAIGWPSDQFSAVIKMEPDGTQFADPVLVKPSTLEVQAYTFPSSSTQSKGELLALASTGDALLLPHFSTIVFVPPKKSCGDKDGWVRTDNAEECAQYAPLTSKMALDCQGNAAYCAGVKMTCCVTPTAESGCSLGSKGLVVTPETATSGPAFCGIDAGVDAGPCPLPAPGSEANGRCTGSFSMSTTGLPDATFGSAVFFPYPRTDASGVKWVVVLSDDGNPCTTLEAAVAQSGDCVQTPDMKHYLAAKFIGDTVAAGTSIGSGYSYCDATPLCFSQGLPAAFQIDDQLDGATTEVHGRVHICDSKTGSQVTATFHAAKCPNVTHLPCND